MSSYDCADVSCDAYDDDQHGCETYDRSAYPSSCARASYCSYLRKR
jgi:hypothetical protein